MKPPAMVSLATFLSVPFAFAGAHGFLHGAVNALHRAQQTRDPQDLRVAKHFLENSIEIVKETDKPALSGLAGRRDAHEAVVQALNALERNDRVAVDKWIERAIKLAEAATRANPR